MAIFPQLLYRFHAIPIKIPLVYLRGLEKTFLEFIWNQKGPRIAKAILGNKFKAGALTITDLELHYKANVMKLA